MGEVVLVVGSCGDRGHVLTCIALLYGEPNLGLKSTLCISSRTLGAT
jgi:hypothetical protein